MPENCQNAINVLCIIGTIFGIFGVLLALYFGVRSGRRDAKKDIQEGAQNTGSMLSDLGYIKGGIDDLKTEFRELRRDQGDQAERIAHCEESTKQAHKRIDETNERIDKLTTRGERYE